MTQVLVIDDEPAVRGLMVAILERAGYDAVEADSARRALELLDDPALALVVSDIVMPGLSGFELLDQVRARRPSLPVLLVTGSGTQDNLAAALAHGAAGLITKPFSHADLREQVASVLSRARRGERELRERVIPQVLARVLASAITVRDLTTGGHTQRLANLSSLLGEKLGLPPAELELVRLGAIFHDIGKIGIPDRILLKEGALESDEWMWMQTHTLIGDRLLESVPELASARPIVRSHHERWDGTGYPDGLAAEEIPVVARLVAVADGIEAMSSHRPYRGPRPPAEILRELQEGRGSQWDPAIVDVAVDLVERGEIVFGPDCLRIPGLEQAA